MGWEVGADALGKRSCGFSQYGAVVLVLRKGMVPCPETKAAQWVTAFLPATFQAVSAEVAALRALSLPSTWPVPAAERGFDFWAVWRGAQPCRGKLVKSWSSEPFFSGTLRVVLLAVLQ